MYPLIQRYLLFFHLLPFLPGPVLGGASRGSRRNLFSIRKYQEGENARSLTGNRLRNRRVDRPASMRRDEETSFA